MSGESNPGKETQQDRSGAGNSQVRPLALGLDAQMARASWKVTSTGQRITNHSTIWGDESWWSGFVQRRIHPQTGDHN